jgi:Mrp family chromosome partitioning ATPase
LSYRSPEPQSSGESALKPLTRAVRAHPVLVGFIFAIAVAVSVLIAESRATSYKTTSQVLVSPVSSNTTAYSGLTVVNDDTSDPVRPFQTAASLLTSRNAALTTADTLGASWTQLKVEQAIAVLPQGESDLLSVTGTAGSPSAAERLTNVYTVDALSGHLATIKAQAQILVSQLVAQQKSLPTSDTVDATTIAQQLVALRTVAAGHDPNFSLVEQAPLPTGASGSSKKLIVILGALAGLMVAIGTAAAVEHLNRRVRDEDEILSEYPLPVLARVPMLPRGGRAATTAALIPPRLQEAYRTLQVQFPQKRDAKARTIMFTSPTAGDGKTSSATNMAMMLTAANLDVALIDFDLRKPDVGNRLGAYTDFMEYFRSNRPLSELLVESSTVPRLRVISSTARGDFTPLLEAVSRRLPEMLRDIEGLVDYVIIDTAPLGQVSDALRIAPLVDDVILVTRVGNTDRTELKRSRELLDRMGHSPTGLLLVGDPNTGDTRYGYGAPPDVASRSKGTSLSGPEKSESASVALRATRPGR